MDRCIHWSLPSIDQVDSVKKGNDYHLCEVRCTMHACMGMGGNKSKMIVGHSFWICMFWQERLFHCVTCGRRLKHRPGSLSQGASEQGVSSLTVTVAEECDFHQRESTWTHTHMKGRVLARGDSTEQSDDEKDRQKDERDADKRDEGSACVLQIATNWVECINSRGNLRWSLCDCIHKHEKGFYSIHFIKDWWCAHRF